MSQWGDITENRYRILGLGLCIAGVLFSPIAYFIVGSAPLTATGISAIMIGFTCIMLAATRPNISPEASEMILKTGMENTAALLEELGLTSKAIYLPSSMTEGHPQALVSLVDGREVLGIKKKIPGRLIVRYGPGPDDLGIAVTTPGSVNIGLLETRPGPTSADIENALSYLLVGVLDIASSVSAHMNDSRLEVEVKGARLHYENVWYYRCLGSPVASIAATVCSEALARPVRILDESYRNGKNSILLEVLK